MSTPRFLVTGGQGFVGAFIARRLLRQKIPFVVFDHKKDDHILSQVLSKQELAGVQRTFGDVSNYNAVEAALKESKATHVIHLAGLQVPTCRVDPIRGAAVNVIGTLNVFEAAKKLGGTNIPIVYASSAAVAGPPEDYSAPMEDDTPHRPLTHYGYFKACNEGNARVYWLDHKMKSVGLRPLTVYGVGREIGMTSAPAKAIKASILGRKLVIPFSGSTSFNYVEDVADVFVDAATASMTGAHALNMKGDVLSIDEYLTLLNEVLPASKDLISVQPGAKGLPLAYDFNQKGLDELLPNQKYTSVRDGIAKTAAIFKQLHAEGRLHDKDLQ
eukprot:TRINITY_DN5008_c0_g1_i2.p4 TRINITY_DN5008_c0_g1~~TRINITY_DN5008_c0_g1_i2.p4  ORF type:complete len:329 (-),score=91.00 TRINITY_DN5008_c0_g1_i2:315-1301(-)